MSTNPYAPGKTVNSAEIPCGQPESTHVDDTSRPSLSDNLTNIDQSPDFYLGHSNINTVPKRPGHSVVSLKTFQHHPVPVAVHTESGFGGAKIKPFEREINGSKPQRYPPPNNAVYNNTELAIMEKEFAEKFKQRDGWNGAAINIKNILDRKVNAAKNFKHGSSNNKKSLGNLIAETINFKRPLFHDPNMMFQMDEPSEREQKEDFARAIDSEMAAGRDPFILCSRCGERHIPPGPPYTLPDRDLCVSMLPEWFPHEIFSEPWEVMIEMVNDLVRIEEMENGLQKDPDRKVIWDEHWHDGDLPQWKAKYGEGFKGGWWKCRNDESASEDERYCKACNMTPKEREASMGAGKRRTQENNDKNLGAKADQAEAAPTKNPRTLAEKKADIEDWMKAAMQQGFEDDRRFVEDRSKESERLKKSQSGPQSEDTLWTETTRHGFPTTKR